MFIIYTMVNSGNQLVSASHGLLQDSGMYVCMERVCHVYISLDLF